MKIFGLKIEREKAAIMPSSRSIVNEQNVNKLYESLLRFLGKDQIIWNQNDLKSLIENGYLFNPDFYAITNKIIQTASMIDWCMYEIKDEKALMKLKSYKKVKNFEAIQEYQRKSLEEIGEHPLKELLEHPNKNQNGISFDQNVLGYYCILGNSYINKVEIAGSPSNEIGELQCLPAHMVKIIYGDTTNPVKGYTIESWMNQQFNFTAEEVYHYKTFNPNYDIGQFLYGAPPSIYPTLKKSNEGYEASVALLQNLGAMGILSSGNDETIDEVTSRAIKDKYASEYGGSKNRGKMMIIGHKMDYVNMAQSVTDLGLIQGQEQDFLTMCRIMNVDSRIMGYVKGSTFSNMNEARKDFIQNRILPLKYMQSESYNEWLLPTYSKGKQKFIIDVDYNAIPELQQDTTALSLRLQNEIKRGIISPNDAAKKLGYAKSEDPKANMLWVGNDMQVMTPVSQEPNKNA